MKVPLSERYAPLLATFKVKCEVPGITLHQINCHLIGSCVQAWNVDDVDILLQDDYCLLPDSLLQSPQETESSVTASHTQLTASWGCGHHVETTSVVFSVPWNSRCAELGKAAYLKSSHAPHFIPGYTCMLLNNCGSSYCIQL